MAGATATAGEWADEAAAARAAAGTEDETTGEVGVSSVRVGSLMGSGSGKMMLSISGVSITGSLIRVAIEVAAMRPRIGSKHGSGSRTNGVIVRRAVRFGQLLGKFVDITTGVR